MYINQEWYAYGADVALRNQSQNPLASMKMFDTIELQMS